MAGTLGLSTPWAREGHEQGDREDIEAAIPDGWTLGVSVDKNRSQWVFWTKDPDGTISHQLRVSHSMSACGLLLRAAPLEACRRHRGHR